VPGPALSSDVGRPWCARAASAQLQLWAAQDSVAP